MKLRALAHSLFMLLLVLCGCAQTGAQAQDMRAYMGGRIIDGDGGAPIEDGVLLIEGARIIAVGERGAVTVPPEAAQIDVSGKTLTPGLVNAHGHVATDAEEKLKTYARYGITTVLSLGDEDESHVALRDSFNTDRGMARLLLAGPIPSPLSAAEAPGVIADLAALGADWVKIRVQNGSIPQPAYEALIKEAHAAGLPLAAHIYTLEDAKGLVDAGADIIAHSVRDKEMDAGLAKKMAEEEICLTPTLMREVSTYVYAQRPAFFDDPFFLAGAVQDDIETLQSEEAQTRAGENLEQGQADLAMAKRNLAIAHEAGVKIALGTDSGAFTGRFPGYFEHLELAHMTDAGMSEADVLHAATGAAADCIGLADVTGRLKPGLQADFLILGANPLDDIANTRKIEAVFIAGRETFEAPQD